MIVEGIPPVQGADLMAGMMDDKLKGRDLDRSKNHFKDVQARIDRSETAAGRPGYRQYPGRGDVSELCADALRGP